MQKTTFNPVFITKKLLNSLDQRPQRVLAERFGLGSGSSRTLESIGQEYGITRERVRQIEAFALNKIRQSNEFNQAQDVFSELKSYIDEMGWLVEEQHFLSTVAKKEDHKPHLLFLLVVGDDFDKIKEDDHFHHSWTTNVDKAEQIKDALKKMHEEMTDDTLFTEKQIIETLNSQLSEISEEILKEEVLLSLLKVSRLLGYNALGEWGVVASPHISPRGMRDYAFLAMKKSGSPMHFSETAKAIEELFGKRAHVQTVHNEVIKDERFILVGRGIYALKEWGYQDGIVRDVIEKILAENTPLSKEEIVKRVLKERYIKQNTVLVNLQNKDFFKKDSQGFYTLA